MSNVTFSHTLKSNETKTFRLKQQKFSKFFIHEYVAKYASLTCKFWNKTINRLTFLNKITVIIGTFKSNES